MKFQLFIFLLSATATDACCSPGSTTRRPVQTTQQLAYVGLFVPAASPYNTLCEALKNKE
jgi:hypothetical protein